MPPSLCHPSTHSGCNSQQIHKSLNRGGEGECRNLRRGCTLLGGEGGEMGSEPKAWAISLLLIQPTLPRSLVWDCSYLKLINIDFCDFNTFGPAIIYKAFRIGHGISPSLLWLQQGFPNKEHVHETHSGSRLDSLGSDPGCATYLLCDLRPFTPALCVSASSTVKWE